MKFVIPAKLMQARDVEQFTRRAVRLRSVEHHPALVTHHLCDSLRQFADSAVHASADVNVRQHRGGVLLPHFARQLHHVNTGRRHIVNMQKFAHRRAAAPHHHLRRVALRSLMKATQQRRDHM